MARTAKTTKTEPVVDAATVDDSMVAADVAAENMNENAVSTDEKKSVGRARKTQSATKAEDALVDSDEIEVMSLIPNVSYEDERTSDFYRWDKAGQIETMTFDAVKAMHRKYKTYFGDMWLRPLDERVIKKLGLVRTYEKYDYLMDESNYTHDNIDNVLDGISSASAGLKISVINRIKDMVAEGVVSDIKVLRKIENRLDIDLISFL